MAGSRSSYGRLPLPVPPSPSPTPSSTSKDDLSLPFPLPSPSSRCKDEVRFNPYLNLHPSWTLDSLRDTSHYLAMTSSMTSSFYNMEANKDGGGAQHRSNRPPTSPYDRRRLSDGSYMSDSYNHPSRHPLPVYHPSPYSSFSNSGRFERTLSEPTRYDFNQRMDKNNYSYKTSAHFPATQDCSKQDCTKCDKFKTEFYDKNLNRTKFDQTRFDFTTFDQGRYESSSHNSLPRFDFGRKSSDSTDITSPRSASGVEGVGQSRHRHRSSQGYESSHREDMNHGLDASHRCENASQRREDSSPKFGGEFSHRDKNYNDTDDRQKPMPGLVRADDTSAQGVVGRCNVQGCNSPSCTGFKSQQVQLFF